MDNIYSNSIYSDLYLFIVLYLSISIKIDHTPIVVPEDVFWWLRVPLQHALQTHAAALMDISLRPALDGRRRFCLGGQTQA